LPLYEYRCPHCSTPEHPTFELMMPMGSAPVAVRCPDCEGDAPRRMSAPNLSQTSSAAFHLLDSTNQSAHEPAVIETRIPGMRTGKIQQFTANPLHQKLPRP